MLPNVEMAITAANANQLSFMLIASVLFGPVMQTSVFENSKHHGWNNGAGC